MRRYGGAKASDVRTNNLYKIKNDILIIFYLWALRCGEGILKTHMSVILKIYFKQIKIPCGVLHGIFYWPRGCAWRILRDSTPGRIGFFSVERVF